jgi:hypothetical protein
MKVASVIKTLSNSGSREANIGLIAERYPCPPTYNTNAALERLLIFQSL